MMSDWDCRWTFDLLIVRTRGISGRSSGNCAGVRNVDGKPMQQNGGKIRELTLRVKQNQGAKLPGRSRQIGTVRSRLPGRCCPERSLPLTSGSLESYHAGVYIYGPYQKRPPGMGTCISASMGRPGCAPGGEGRRGGRGWCPERGWPPRQEADDVRLVADPDPCGWAELRQVCRGLP